MSTPRKPELDERFADWVDGRLKASERAALEAEMARDPALQRAADDYRRGVQLVRSALAPQDMGDSLADAVMARIAKPALRPPRTWRPYLASAIAAAAIVLVFVVVRTIPPAADPVRSEVARSTRDTSDVTKAGASPNNDEERKRAPAGELAEELAGIRPVGDSESALKLRQATAGDGERVVREQAPRKPGSPVPIESERVDLGAAKLLKDMPKLEEPPPASAVTPAPVVAPEPGAPEPKVKPSAPGDGDQRPVVAGEDKVQAQSADLEDRLDLLSLGDVALVAEVAAASDAELWRELDARAASGVVTAAEVLASLGGATENEGKRAESQVDLRRLMLTVVPGLFAGRVVADDVKAESPALTRFRDKSTAAAPEQRKAKSAADGGAATAMQLMPGDRVYRLAGTPDELRAFTASLHARVSADRGRVAIERFRLSDAPPARSAGGRVPGPAGPASPGPASGSQSVSAPGARGVPKESPSGGKIDAPARAGTIEILLVLRARG